MIRSHWITCCLLVLGTSAPGFAQRPPPGVPAGVKVHRNLPYVPEGGERQQLDLYVPESASGPLPLIVWIHGGGWRAGNKNNTGPVLPLAGRGYVVASINYRLSQDAIFPAQLEDCKAAIRYLRANAATYHIDPHRIGVGGASAGGHLAALLGTTGDVQELEGPGGHPEQSSRVQAVLDWFGPTDLTRMGGSHDRPGSPEALLLGGPVQEHKDRAARANPITYISGDEPPFLILHGDQDKTVPFSQSELLAEALRKAERDVTLITIPGAGHGGAEFFSEENRRRIETFFDQHLKPSRSQAD